MDDGGEKYVLSWTTLKLVQLSITPPYLTFQFSDAGIQKQFKKPRKKTVEFSRKIFILIFN